MSKVPQKLLVFGKTHYGKIAHASFSAESSVTKNVCGVFRCAVALRILVAPELLILF